MSVKKIKLLVSVLRKVYLFNKGDHEANCINSKNPSFNQLLGHTKYLGVTISDDLRWNRHIADITGRANKLLGLLRRNLSTCDRRVKEAAYLGLVSMRAKHRIHIRITYQTRSKRHRDALRVL